MVNVLSIIEEQASEKVSHFRGSIPQGFKVLFGGYSSDLCCGFGRPQPQNHPAHLFPSSRPNRGAGHSRSAALCRGHRG